MLNSKEAIEIIDKLLIETEEKYKDLPDEIKALEGPSGLKYRYFIGRLLATIDRCRFLEIGCWKGSTAISALSGNLDKIDKYWLIDNWSLFGGPKEEFFKNFETVCKAKPNLLDVDCFNIDPSELDILDVDVYFYDGGHEFDEQAKALTHWVKSMNNTFIFIVDDTNWSWVKQGTKKGISDSNLNIAMSWKFDTSTPDNETWWNGMYIYVLEKTKI